MLMRAQTQHHSRSDCLRGKTVCLVFEHSLSHYTRLLQEIEALAEAGATVSLLTSHQPNSSLELSGGIMVVPIPEFATSVSVVPASTHPSWFVRIPSNLMRMFLQKCRGLARPGRLRRNRIQSVRRLSRLVDVFWVIDFLSLPETVRGTRGSKSKIVYETVDLVPEYFFAEGKLRTRKLRAERDLIQDVDGFITAGESYADYYMERFGGVLRERPFVRDNMPDVIVESPKPTRPPLSMLFIGSLMHDRPIEDLIHAVALATTNFTLDFQGKNYLGEQPIHLINELGLAHRVRILPPCPPGEIVQAASLYDVGIVALRGENENERRASTSKLFTCMSAGLAIVGSDLPGISRIVSEHRNGLLVPDCTPQDWAMALDSVASMDLKEIEAMRRRSVEAARMHSWDIQKNGFLDVFNRALRGRNGVN